MTGIDDRVVSMQFDNAQFDSKIADTLKSLDKLKSSLDFTESQRHLGDLDEAGKKFNLDGIASAAEGVSGKFLAMATVGLTALSNITNRAVSAGIQVVKSFTLEPITQGFDNFQNKMTSVSTILANTASKGTKLADVQNSLGVLNDYANKTIYDFSQMTQNLGTFTAAGVDLKTSQESIKGIANVAAISGSNTQQASTAMYQLSQAMAAGQVHLQDWNSVVNAGMGGQTFQKALFDTGVALKQIPNVPVGQTFEQWTAKGNSFRESLQSGWLNTKVLTTTLNAFTGDFTAAQLQQMGYSKQQAADMAALGQTGLQAATQIKSVTALMDMLKENTAAGWAQSFQILAGNYDQAVGLFTEVGNALGGVVASSAKARNDLLQGWSDLGGRAALIDGFKNAIKALGNVIQPIRDSFRDFFPKETSEELATLSKQFDSLMKFLIPSVGTMLKIRVAADGIFATLSIGKEVIKGVLGVFETLIANIFGRLVSGGGILNLLDKFGIAMINFQTVLVGEHKIADVFDKIDYAIGTFFTWVIKARDGLTSLFDGFSLPKSKAVADAADTVGQRLTFLETIGKRLVDVWKHIAPVFDAVKNVLSGLWAYVSQWFGQLGHNLAAAMGPGDFNGVVDIINVGLVGGVVVLLKRFLDGFNLDKFTGGLFDQVKTSLDQVTKTLSAMQTQLKAKALMEIAIALGVLTASIVALSLINSADLSKALVAISVSFGALIGAMAALDKVVGSNSDAAKMGVVALGLNLIATAMLTMSAAVKVMSTMSWGEIAKGLSGIAGVLLILVAAVEAMPPGAMIATGAAMIPLATGLVIMGGAVKLFATMSWAEMAKGLVGLAGGLLIIAGSMNLMPPGTILAAGIAMIPLATGITILAGAIKIFGTMSWSEMGKGLLAMAGALLIIGAAMEAMPITLPITAAGLVIVGIAMGTIAEAIKVMGAASIGTIAKGIGAFAVVLLILGAALQEMQAALPGAAALMVTAIAMGALTEVLIKLGSQDIKVLAIGLGAIAAVMVVLGLAALVMEPVIPALLALGAAIGLIGIGFALFGVGAYAVAKAFQVLAEAGVTGTKALIDAIVLVIKAVPTFVQALIDSVTQSAEEFLKAGTTLLKIATVFLAQLLDTVIQLAPKIAKALMSIVDQGIILIRSKVPDLIELGFFVLSKFLKGILDHMDDILITSEIIMVRFAKNLSAHADMLVNAAIDLLNSFLSALGARAADLGGMGLTLLLAFLKGMADNVVRVIEAVANIVVEILNGLAQAAGQIIQAGANLVIHLVAGIGFNLIRIVNVVGDIITTFVSAVGGQATKIADAGANALVKFIEGVGRDFTIVANKGTDVAIAFLDAIGSDAVRFTNAAGDALVKFLNGMADAIRTHTLEIQDAGRNIAGAILDGMTLGLASKASNVVDGAINVVKGGVGGVMHFIGANSPSKLFRQITGYMTAGMVQEFDQNTSVENSAVAHAERIVRAFQNTIINNPELLEGLDANPVITPVLDLSKVKTAAGGLDQLMSVGAITPGVSVGQARLISTTAETSGAANQPSTKPSGDTIFTQTINAPKALSTKDIYRNTKSLIAMKKEELNL